VWVLQVSAEQADHHQDAVNASVDTGGSPTATIKPEEQEYREWMTAIAVEATQEMERALQQEIPTSDPDFAWPTHTPGPSPTPWRPNSTPLPGGGVLVTVQPTTRDPILSTSPWWYIEREDRRVTVVVGAKAQYEHPEDRVRSFSQGIVIVREETTELVPDTLSNERYYTPQRAGPVQITDATGMVLELTAEDGTIFLFDVATRQFVTDVR
jgi:hypothetical protein